MFDSDLTPMFAGLDLAAGGKDYSALALAEVYEVPTGEQGRWVHTGGVFDRTEEHFVVTGLHRWPLGTDPGDVLVETAELLARPELAWCRLRYDATGLGAGVRSIARDLYQRGYFSCGFDPVTITGGQHSEAGTPKVDLVSRMSRLIHETRLHVLEGEHVKQWRIEMQAYQQKVTAAGNLRYEAQSESVHDDLVMATALAVNHRRHPKGPRTVSKQWLLTGVLGQPVAQVSR